MAQSSPYRVFIYVQHLLGVGHLQRARLLAQALVAAGFEVDLVSGGRPQGWLSAQGLRVHQLPPVYSPDGSFSRLLDARHRDIDEAWKNRRRDQLLALLQRVSPQVLITETFPFGRRMLSFELIPLLERARELFPAALLISSIRDILQPKSSPGRIDEIVARIDRYYDYVLVHGDERIAALGLSFSAAERIAARVFYSGYICRHDGETPPAEQLREQVLVSAGGSHTGFELLQTALAARPLCSLARHPWRILVSPTVSADSMQRLQAAARGNVIVERNRDDFFALMQNAKLSISQAGYNTTTDVLRAHTPAVMVPYAEADEVEQSLRASALAQRGRIALLEARQLGPARLAEAIEEALTLETRLEVDLDGAANSARQVHQWLRRHDA